MLSTLSTAGSSSSTLMFGSSSVSSALTAVTNPTLPEHVALAIAAAKSRNKMLLQVLLDNSQAKLIKDLDEVKANQTPGLIMNWRRTDQASLTAKFNGLLIPIVRKYIPLGTDPIDQIGFSNALEDMYQIAENYLVESYEEELKARGGVVQGSEVKPLPEEASSDSVDTSSLIFKNAIEAHRSDVIKPFLDNKKSQTKIYTVCTADGLDVELKALINEEKTALDTVQACLKSVNPLTKIKDILLKEFEKHNLVHNDRIWKVLPTIRRILNARCLPLPFEGKTENEINTLTAADLASWKLSKEEIIASIKNEVERLELNKINIPVEIKDERGYTLLYLAAMGENVEDSLELIESMKGRAKSINEEIHCAEFEQITNCLNVLEFLFKEHAANAWVRDPYDDQGYDMVIVNEDDETFDNGKLKQISNSNKNCPIILKNKDGKIRIWGSVNGAPWQSTPLNETFFYHMEFPNTKGTVRSKTAKLFNTTEGALVYQEIAKKSGHAHSKTPTLFHFFNRLNICKRAFLQILFEYAYKQRPQHRLLDGGISAASPHIKNHLTNQAFDHAENILKEYDVHLNSTTPSFFKRLTSIFSYFATNPNRADELKKYQSTVKDYVKKYSDIEILYVLAKEMTMKTSKGLLGRSSLHDGLIENGEEYQDLIKIDLPTRELLCLKTLSLLDTTQDPIARLQSLLDESQAIKQKLMFENAKLKSDLEIEERAHDQAKQQLKEEVEKNMASQDTIKQLKMKVEQLETTNSKTNTEINRLMVENKCLDAQLLLASTPATSSATHTGSPSTKSWGMSSSGGTAGTTASTTATATSSTSTTGRSEDEVIKKTF